MEQQINDLGAQTDAMSIHGDIAQQEPTVAIPPLPAGLPAENGEAAQVVQMPVGVGAEATPTAIDSPAQDPVRLTQEQDAKRNGAVMAAIKCPHPGLDVNTDYRTSTHHETGNNITREVTITLRCSQCKMPMCFVGVPVAEPRQVLSGPRSDAMGMTLTADVVPGYDAFKHFHDMLDGKPSPLAPPAPTVIDSHAAPEARPEGFLRKGLRKVGEVLQLQPGTRPEIAPATQYYQQNPDDAAPK